MQTSVHHLCLACNYIYDVNDDVKGDDSNGVSCVYDIGGGEKKEKKKEKKKEEEETSISTQFQPNCNSISTQQFAKFRLGSQNPKSEQKVGEKGQKVPFSKTFPLNKESIFFIFQIAIPFPQFAYLA